jgi:hypothetical protein
VVVVVVVVVAVVVIVAAAVAAVVVVVGGGVNSISIFKFIMSHLQKWDKITSWSVSAECQMWFQH